MEEMGLEEQAKFKVEKKGDCRHLDKGIGMNERHRVVINTDLGLLQWAWG